MFIINNFCSVFGGLFTADDIPEALRAAPQPATTICESFFNFVLFDTFLDVAADEVFDTVPVVVTVLVVEILVAVVELVVILEILLVLEEVLLVRPG